MSLHILQLILSSTGAYWEHYWELDNSYVLRQKISSYDGPVMGQTKEMVANFCTK